MPDVLFGREEQQQLFRETLAGLGTRSGSAASPVLLVQAPTGMGKSELLASFARIARGQGGDVAYANRFRVVEIDWEDCRDKQPDQYPGVGAPPLLPMLGVLLGGILDTIRDQRNWRRPEKAFEPFYALAEQLRDWGHHLDYQDQQIAEGGKLAGAGDKIADAATVLASLNGATVPLIPLAQLPRFLGRGQGRRSRTRRKTPLQADDHLRPREALVREFAAGVHQLSRDKPLVLLLDTCEIVFRSLRWLAEAAKATGPRVLWVMAGRPTMLEPGDSLEAITLRKVCPADDVRVVSLPPLSIDHVRSLVPSMDDAGIAELVHSMTNGVPLEVALACELLDTGAQADELMDAVTRQGGGKRHVDELTRRYLVHAHTAPGSLDDANLLERFALIYGDHDDPKLLRSVWSDVDDIDGALRELAERHDFVYARPRRMHSEVCAAVRNYLLDSVRREKLESVNERAAAILLERLRGRSLGTVEDQFLDREWRAAATSLVWHRFWIDNRRGIELLCELMPGALLLQPTMARELVKLACFFADTASNEERELLRGLAALAADEDTQRLGGTTLFEMRVQRALRKATAGDRRLVLAALARQAERPQEVAAGEPPAAALVLMVSADFDPDAHPERRDKQLHGAAALVEANGGLLASGLARRLRHGYRKEQDAPPRRAAEVELAAEFTPRAPPGWMAR